MEYLAWRALDRLVGQNKEEDESAIQKGIITRVTEILDKAQTGSGQPLEEREVLQTAVRILGTLSTVASSDQILTKANTVKVIIALCKETSSQQHHKTQLLEEAITCLALMAPRTRHKRSILKCGGLPLLVDILKKHATSSAIVIAICRFLTSFAQKQEHTYQIVENQGIETLISAFNIAGCDGGQRDDEVVAAVSSAIWACTVDNVEAQRFIWRSGWLQDLAQSMIPKSPCPEAAFGILRRVAVPQKGDGIVSPSHATMPRGPGMHDYTQDIVVLGVLSDAILQQGFEFPQNGEPIPGKVKECAGFIGNLAADSSFRELLRDTCALKGIVSALEVACFNGERDRKVGKMTLNALQNLTICPTVCADLFRKTEICNIVLFSMRTYAQNAQVLEGAIGVLSHLAQDHNCCQRLLEGGAAEALLAFALEWIDDVMVTKRCLIALRRLMITQVPTMRNVLMSESNRGLHTVMDALKKHIYDEALATEAVMIVEMMDRNPELHAITLGPCLRAGEHHSDLEPVLARVFGSDFDALHASHCA